MYCVINPYMDAARLASDAVVMLDEVLVAVLYPALLQTGFSGCGP
jgi:hypothetical protein